MLKRVLTSIVAVVVFLPFLIFSHTLALPIAMAICAFISVYEVLHCVGLHKNLWLSLPLYPMAAALPLLMRGHGVDITLRAGGIAFLLVVLTIGSILTIAFGKLHEPLADTLQQAADLAIDSLFFRGNVDFLRVVICLHKLPVPVI